MLTWLSALVMAVEPSGWASNPRVLADLAALTAPDAIHRTEHGRSFSRGYSDALTRLPGHVQRYEAEDGFLQRLAEVLGRVDEPQLTTAALNAMSDDAGKRGLVQALAGDLEAKGALWAMTAALDRLRVRDAPVLPDLVLPTLERLLLVDDARFARDGWADTDSERFRARATQLLAEHFASNDRFVDYLWRVARRGPAVETCRRHERVLRGYAGPRAEAFIAHALQSDDRGLRSFAVSMVVEPRLGEGLPVVRIERAALFPLAAQAAVDLGRPPVPGSRAAEAAGSPDSPFVRPVAALEALAAVDHAGLVGLFDLYEATQQAQCLTAVHHLVAQRRGLLTAADWGRLMRLLEQVPASRLLVGQVLLGADLGAGSAVVRQTLSTTSSRAVAEAVGRGLAGQPDEVRHAVLEGVERFGDQAKLGVLEGLASPRPPGPLLAAALRPLLGDPNPAVVSAAHVVLDLA